MIQACSKARHVKQQKLNFAAVFIWFATSSTVKMVFGTNHKPHWLTYQIKGLEKGFPVMSLHLQWATIWERNHPKTFSAENQFVCPRIYKIACRILGAQLSISETLLYLIRNQLCYLYIPPWWMTSSFQLLDRRECAFSVFNGYLSPIFLSYRHTRCLRTRSARLAARSSPAPCTDSSSPPPHITWISQGPIPTDAQSNNGD